MVLSGRTRVWSGLFWMSLLLGCTAPNWYLPSRPLREIDIQGHERRQASVKCPAVYDAPHGNLRFCL